MVLIAHRKKAALSVGIGVDIERIARFRRRATVFQSGASEKIFTPREQAYCRTKNDPAPHFAARFAAKEAVMKALSSLGARRFTISDYCHIEITRTNGAPRVHLSGFPEFRAQITLSHDRTSAIAFAIAWRVRHLS